MTRPLRVAVFVHEFPALSETFVLGEITGLLDRGCEVRVFARAARDEPLVHADVTGYGLLRLCCYLAMPVRRWSRIRQALRLVGHLGARRFGTILRSLNVFRYGRAALSLELFFWVCRLREVEHRFDVIHCHFGVVGRVAAFLREIGAIEGCLATTFHGVDVSRSLRGSPGLYNHLFAHGDVFLPVSEHWRESLIRHGCDPHRITVHYLGVDQTRFRFRTRSPDPDGRLRLLSVGRLVEKKGIGQALRAVAMAYEFGVRLRYTIIGDGPLREDLEAMADSLGIRKLVTFKGWQCQDDIEAAMYAHDVLLAPSVTDSEGDQEGIPVTLMEAMATGMPVISTFHSGIPELVKDQVSGLLARERDICGLADAVVAVARNRNLALTMGRNAWAAVSVGFSAATQTDKLLTLFTEHCGTAIPARSAESGHLKLMLDS